MRYIIAYLAHLWALAVGPRKTSAIRSDLRQLRKELSKSVEQHNDAAAFYNGMATAHATEAASAETLRMAIPNL